MKIDGRCHCGFIAYEAEADPERAAICHCTDCQELSGGPFRAVLPTQAGTFKITAGSPTIYIKTTADSGTPREHAFCPKCGAPIYATSTGPDPKPYSVRLGNVRQRRELPPKRQTWARSRLPWVSALASLPASEGQ